MPPTTIILVFLDRGGPAQYFYQKISGGTPDIKKILIKNVFSAIFGLGKSVKKLKNYFLCPPGSKFFTKKLELAEIYNICQNYGRDPTKIKNFGHPKVIAIKIIQYSYGQVNLWYIP